MPTLEQGRIIWAVIPDRNGFAKPNPRPALVMEDVLVNSPDDEIPVVVGSTQVFEPLPDDQVLIHKDYTRDPLTKLSRPTTMVCSWTAVVRYGDIQEVGGFLRGKRSYPIIEKALRLKGASDPSAS